MIFEHGNDEKKVDIPTYIFVRIESHQIFTSCLLAVSCYFVHINIVS